MTGNHLHAADHPADIGAVWQQTLPVLAEALNSKITMETWIKPLEAVLSGRQKDSFFIVLQAPDDFVMGYAKQYEPLIINALKIVTGADYQIYFVTDLDQVPADIREQEAVISSATRHPTGPTFSGQHFLPEQPAIMTNPDTGEIDLYNRYTFDSFIVGEGNRFAHAACVAVANQQSSQINNPLFLYGGSGLGKTHLMHAIGNHIKQHFPQKKLIYIPCEQFVNEFIKTIGKGSYEGFRNKYRNCDLLMIDDIQFIEEKEQMQIEFFHTFNTLYEQGSNIVMTCDKPPNSLSLLEDRLRTRFASGLIVDIQKPDYETRVAILNRRCEENNIQMPKDIIEYIAGNIRSNIRELEGACNTVIAYASLSGEINLSIATDALKDIINPTAKKNLNETGIINLICNYYEISKADIMSKRRNKEISYPRQVAMYFLRTELDLTYEQIAKTFNNHYSTVMHSCEKISGMIKENDKTASEIKNLRQNITM